MKRLILIVLVFVGLNAKAQDHFPPHIKKGWKVLEPKLKLFSLLIKDNQTDRCLTLFNGKSDEIKLKNTLLEANKSISSLTNFSHTSFGFSMLDSNSYEGTIDYVSKDFKTIYQIVLVSEVIDEKISFSSIELRDTKYFDALYEENPETLPPSAPPPSSPPPPPK